MGIGADLLMEQMLDDEIDQMLRERQYREDYELVSGGIWRMKDGSLIQISKMSFSHLQNAISMLRRNQPMYSEPYLELALMAIQQMKAEITKRLPKADPTEGFFEDSEDCPL